MNRLYTGLFVSGLLFADAVQTMDDQDRAGIEDGLRRQWADERVRHCGGRIVCYMLAYCCTRCLWNTEVSSSLSEQKNITGTTGVILPQVMDDFKIK